mmetsp:Transcript_26823/g.31654  ORF Transcript_26823/g.31654 Transcript_26823/m.31654 type:complete len:96 (-) Transcript_26823:11-298(-)
MDGHEYDEPVHDFVDDVVVVDDIMNDELEWKCDENGDGGKRNGLLAGFELNTTAPFELQYTDRYISGVCYYRSCEWVSTQGLLTSCRLFYSFGSF